MSNPQEVKVEFDNNALYGFGIPLAVPKKRDGFFNFVSLLAKGARASTALEDMAHFSNLLQENPDSSDAHALMAATLEGYGENQGAFELYEKAAQLSKHKGEEAHLWGQSARCAANAGNRKKEFENLNKAMNAYMAPQSFETAAENQNASKPGMSA